jgi:hypothetical protein
MKKMFKISALLMLLMAFSAATFGQVTVTANATAVLQAPLTITTATPLNFGVLASTGGGTATIATDGSRTVTAGITELPGATTAASFNVTGIALATFTISIPVSITLTHTLIPANTMTVNNFVRNPAAPGDGALDGAGTATILIGADLVIAAGQVAGTYSNTTDLDVTINYN